MAVDSRYVAAFLKVYAAVTDLPEKRAKAG
jgi:hypothetical protein